MVDMTGKFYLIEDLDPDFVKQNIDVEAYSEYAGRYVKNAYDAALTADDATLDIDICVLLKQTNKVFKIEKHVHSYPHCWRTDKPVLYYPLDSWFIRTTACPWSHDRTQQHDKLETAVYWVGTFRKVASKICKIGIFPVAVIGELRYLFGVPKTGVKRFVLVRSKNCIMR